MSTPTPLDPQPIFDAMPTYFKSEQAAGVNSTIQFDLQGEKGGLWYVTVADGTCAVNKGTAPNPAAATVRMTVSDFVELAVGKLSPALAFMTGKVKIDGDMGAVIKQQSLLGTS
jgi:putative sterol carrier protein